MTVDAGCVTGSVLSNSHAANEDYTDRPCGLRVCSPWPAACSLVGAPRGQARGGSTTFSPTTCRRNFCDGMVPCTQHAQHTQTHTTHEHTPQCHNSTHRASDTHTHTCHIQARGGHRSSVGVWSAFSRSLRSLRSLRSQKSDIDQAPGTTHHFHQPSVSGAHQATVHRRTIMHRPTVGVIRNLICM